MVSGGDLNGILSSDGKLGRREPSTFRMRDFKDLGFFVPKYTWWIKDMMVTWFLNGWTVGSFPCKF